MKYGLFVLSEAAIPLILAKRFCNPKEKKRNWWWSLGISRTERYFTMDLNMPLDKEISDIVLIRKEIYDNADRAKLNVALSSYEIRVLLSDQDIGTGVPDERVFISDAFTVNRHGHHVFREALLHMWGHWFAVYGPTYYKDEPQQAFNFMVGIERQIDKRLSHVKTVTDKQIAEMRTIYPNTNFDQIVERIELRDA